MVVGGGLLACEVAASLRQMKMKVSVMHRHSMLLNRYLDSETATWVTGYFAKSGVTLLLGESLNGFEGKTVLRNIQTKSGNRVQAGLAVVACGAEPSLDLVRNTPLAGPHGSPVNDYLETEEKGIYAIGDLAFYPDRLMGGMRRQTHWENSREQGLVAGANMTGKKRIRYEQLPYFWTECSICDSILWVISRCNRRGWTLLARTRRRNLPRVTIKATDYEAFWSRREQRNKLIRLKTSCVELWANKLLVIINRARVRRAVSRVRESRYYSKGYGHEAG
jgi:NAD(P)H-nitrite reductase